MKVKRPFWERQPLKSENFMRFQFICDDIQQMHIESEIRILMCSDKKDWRELIEMNQEEKEAYLRR